MSRTLRNVSVELFTLLNQHLYLNSKCDVTLSLLLQNVRLQAAVYNKNSYHCTLTNIM